MKQYVGEIISAKVGRMTDIGCMLEYDGKEVLLHKREVTDELVEGKYVDVFLYNDSEDRVTATLVNPEVTVNSFGWVDVVEVKRKLGVFVNIGIEAKDFLIDSGDLPIFTNVWPKEGDRLYCKLKRTNSNRLLAKMATVEDMENDVMVYAPDGLYNKNVNGYVFKTMREGSHVITDEHFLGFIHNSQRKREPRLGERVSGRIIALKEDGSINISLLPRKQESLDDDAVTLLSYMEHLGGSMPFWDKSDPEDIKNTFGMSKAAFKRAIGRLLKEDKIYQKDGWTYIK
ncbi:MAG: S1 RNA-binding domain-containing protein [Bacillaceae bacterium]